MRSFHDPGDQVTVNSSSKKNHPASPRLPIVVSAGKKTVLNCNITPGTHPNQDVLCGSNEFDSLEVIGTPEVYNLKICLNVRY